MNRRKFLQKTAVSTAAVGLSSPAMKMMAGERVKKGAGKVGLYSITFLGVWYKGDALTLDDIVGILSFLDSIYLTALIHADPTKDAAIRIDLSKVNVILLNAALLNNT